jgi:hypothetical protein
VRARRDSMAWGRATAWPGGGRQHGLGAGWVFKLRQKRAHGLARRCAGLAMVAGIGVEISPRRPQKDLSACLIPPSEVRPHRRAFFFARRAYFSLPMVFPARSLGR